MQGWTKGSLSAAKAYRDPSNRGKSGDWGRSTGHPRQYPGSVFWLANSQRNAAHFNLWWSLEQRIMSRATKERPLTQRNCNARCVLYASFLRLFQHEIRVVMVSAVT